MPDAFLGLGTNLGDRLENLRGALERLREFVRLEAVSSVYRTEPVGYREQPDFWNIVVRANTSLTPDGLLRICKTVETAMGRGPSFRNAPRIIDIDLLLYGDAQLREPDLIVPHPRLTERAFVLVPLLELEPDARHPATGERLTERLERGGLEAVEKVHPPESVFVVGGPEPLDRRDTRRGEE